MKSIETHARAFLTLDILSIGTVLGRNPLFNFQTTSIFSSLFRRLHSSKDDNHLSILNQKFHGYIWKPKILSKCEFLFILQKKFCFKEKGGENLEESTKKMLKRNCNMVTLTANQMVLAQTQEDCCFTKKIFMRHDSLGLLRPVSFFVISHLVDSNRTQSHHREVPRWEIFMEQ